MAIEGVKSRKTGVAETFVFITKGFAMFTGGHVITAGSPANINGRQVRFAGAFVNITGVHVNMTKSFAMLAGWFANIAGAYVNITWVDVNIAKSFAAITKKVAGMGNLVLVNATEGILKSLGEREMPH